MTQRQMLETLARQANSRFLRGGSWLNDGLNCRSAYRFNYFPDYRNDVVGFHVVLIRRQHDTKTVT